MPYVFKLNGTITADGNTDSFMLTSEHQYEATGFYLHLSGTFGGGTVHVQFLAADGNWKSIKKACFTGDSDALVLIQTGSDIRLNLDGATSPSIYYEISASGSSIFLDE